jgi:membrane protein
MAAMAVVRGVRARVKEHNLSLVAAGVAFYAMLAIFPAIISVVTIYALVSDPAQVHSQLEPTLKSLPEDVANLVSTQLTSAVSKPHGGLTLGLVVGLAGTLWAASGGINALLSALDDVYGAAQPRGFVKQRGLSLLFTVGALFAAIIAIGLLAVLPAVSGRLGLGGAARTGLQIGRWVVLAVLVALGLSILYRTGPNAPGKRHRWLSPGVLVAMLVWLAGSAGFTVYVSFFGSYDKTYGSLAAVIVLLLWLYVSAFAVLVGAEVDAQTLPATEASTSASGASTVEPDGVPERAGGDRPARGR